MPTLLVHTWALLSCHSRSEWNLVILGLPDHQYHSFDATELAQMLQQPRLPVDNL